MNITGLYEMYLVESYKSHVLSKGKFNIFLVFLRFNPGREYSFR
jgi:hypothetical protein